MSTVSRAALAASALLLGPAAPAGAAGTGTVPSGPSADHPFCWTRALTDEAMRAGATSVVSCYESFAGLLAAAGIAAPGATAPAPSPETVASGILAIHYDGANGTGSSLTITGSECSGGGVAFGASDPWNDLISSTRHRGCSQVKHWSESNYSGDVQLTSGGDGVLQNLNGTLSNRVSSMRYYGPEN